MKLLGSWEGQVLKLASSLGLTPAARARIGSDAAAGRAGVALEEHLRSVYGGGEVTVPKETPLVGLVAACKDESLLRFPLWVGQRQLLRSLESALAAGDWLNVWCIGRRSGKSTLGALVALWCCLLRPDLDELAGATGRSHAIIIATNLKQARHVVQMAAEIVSRSQLLCGAVERVTLDEITFKNGTALTAFPASSRGGRGRAVRCLILDEAAHMADADSGSPLEAEAIFGRCCRPRRSSPAARQLSSQAPRAEMRTGLRGWFGGTRGRVGARPHLHGRIVGYEPGSRRGVSRGGGAA